jgi:hypothetical protein
VAWASCHGLGRKITATVGLLLMIIANVDAIKKKLNLHDCREEEEEAMVP